MNDFCKVKSSNEYHFWTVAIFRCTWSRSVRDERQGKTSLLQVKSKAKNKRSRGYARPWPTYFVLLISVFSGRCSNWVQHYYYEERT